MNRRLRIQHTCEYRYEFARQYSAHALRLTPRRDGFQHTLYWTLHTPGRRAEQLDAHGNITHLLTLEESHKYVEVVVTGLVETTWSERVMPHEGLLSPLTYLAFTPLTRPDEPLWQLAQANRPQNGAGWEWMTQLGREVRALRPAKAATQDIAHAYLGCCRAAGVPARLVNCPTCDKPARTMDHTLAEDIYDYVI